MNFQAPINFSLVIFFVLPWFYKRYRSKTSLRHPDISIFVTKKPKRFLYGIPLLLSVLVLFAALADPRQGTVEETTEEIALEIMLTFDLSGSMGLGGKMQILRRTAKEFIEKMEGHRLGIVIYSTNAYVWCPPTNDPELLVHYVDKLSVDILDGLTAVGRGILLSSYVMFEPYLDMNLETFKGLAAGGEKLESLNLRGKVVVLFTDGKHNTGIAPIHVANLVKDSVRIYYLQVGPGGYGYGGQKVIDAVEATGGKYYSMESMDQLSRAYSEIASLEKGRIIIVRERRSYPLYPYFLLVGVTLLGVGFLIKKLFFMEV